MKKISKLLFLFSILFLLFLSSCEPKSSATNYDSYKYSMYKDGIGFVTENEPLETHNVKVYYGVPEGTIEFLLGDYDILSLDRDFESLVKFELVRKVYKTTAQNGIYAECKEELLYEETNTYSHYFLDGFKYGVNYYIDTIKKDDLFLNEKGYGIIVYVWYLTSEKNASTLRGDIKKVPSTELYYKIVDDKIVFKLAKTTN